MATHILKVEKRSTRRDPYFCTKCPDEIIAMSEPIEPRLIYVPNSPLERPRFAFTSGNRGTQLMISNAKRKKIIPM
jgi:hypothetical protein